MTHLESLLRYRETFGLESEILAEALRDIGQRPEVQDAASGLKDDAQSSATISSLYLGFRLKVLEQRDGWNLTIARMTEQAEAISTPTGCSAALCLASGGPIEFEHYEDPAPKQDFDVRRGDPVTVSGKSFVSPGDVVVTRPGAPWSAPIGKFDVTFLKLDGPATVPMSVAFDRRTLLPVSVGFADQDHTARDFFASLISDLMRQPWPILQSMPASEREALEAYLHRQGAREDVHLVTRWKFLQSLGQLRPSAALEILEGIGRQSQSIIGQKARAICDARRSEARAA